MSALKVICDGGRAFGLDLELDEAMILGASVAPSSKFFIDLSSRLERSQLHKVEDGSRKKDVSRSTIC